MLKTRAAGKTQRDRLETWKDRGHLVRHAAGSFGGSPPAVKSCARQA